ncbi:hypothetical protein ACLB2K_040101 [Fragaria x ananassa]
MVEGVGFNYYGVLVSVIELIYGKGMPVVLFKCKWFNIDPTNEGVQFWIVACYQWTQIVCTGRDDESGPSEPTTDQLNEPYQEKSPYVVSDTEDIRVNNQHIPTIIGYIPITPSELNPLQRNPNHDDDGFIDDEYIEDDEYSDQIEEDDDSDDSDYHEYN